MYPCNRLGLFFKEQSRSVLLWIKQAICQIFSIRLHSLKIQNLLFVLCTILFVTLSALTSLASAKFTGSKSIIFNKKSEPVVRKNLETSQLYSKNTEVTPAQLEVRSSVWDVYVRSDGRSGTGFFVEPDLFIANLHVLEQWIIEKGDFSDILISQGDRKVSVKDVLSISIIYDLVLIQTTRPVNAYLNISTEEPKKDDLLFLTGGYTPETNLFDERKKVGPITFSNSIYTFAVDFGLTDQRIRLNGFSGSPVFNQDAEVVGVLIMGVENLVSVIRSSNLLLFIQNQTGTVCNGHVKECVGRDLRVERKKAKDGDYDSQLGLAKFLWKFKPSQKESLKWAIEASEETEDILSKLLLADRYSKEENGDYFNPELAFSLYKKVADRGHPYAQFKVAHMESSLNWYQKITADIDYLIPGFVESSLDWYQESAIQGFVPSLIYLAEFYHEKAEASAAEENVKNWLYWLQQLANQGSSIAQFNLGRIYHQGIYREGNGILEKNEELAFQWYLKASQKGHQQALSSLGKLIKERLIE